LKCYTRRMDIEISVAELKTRMDSGTPPLLIDVREPWENERCSIPGAKLIPMRQVPEELESLKAETREIVVHCHHGGRSMRVVSWLRSQGVASARNLSGGIDSWAAEIDPSVARY
jgi:rhodanese-related sulfurtransferase